MTDAVHLGDNIFERDLPRGAANSTALTPLSFLERSAAVYPDKTAVIHGSRAYSYREFHERCRRLASALAKRGIGPGDCVTIMAPNVPAMLEAHYAVPMLGAVLNALNFRLDAATIAFILEHGEAKALITDKELSPVVGPALEQLGKPLLVIDIDDELGAGGALLGEMDYEALPGDRRSGLPARPAARRMAVDLPALHLGHHGQSQGRGLSPSGRLPERHRQPDHLRPAAGLGLPLDPADVPLQRLDLHLGGDRGGGDPRLPAQGRPGADLSLIARIMA